MHVMAVSRDSGCPHCNHSCWIKDQCFSLDGVFLLLSASQMVFPPSHKEVANA